MSGEVKDPTEGGTYAKKELKFDCLSVDIEGKLMGFAK